MFTQTPKSHESRPQVGYRLSSMARRLKCLREQDVVYRQDVDELRERLQKAFNCALQQACDQEPVPFGTLASGYNAWWQGSHALQALVNADRRPDLAHLQAYGREIRFARIIPFHSDFPQELRDNAYTALDLLESLVDRWQQIAFDLSHLQRRARRRAPAPVAFNRGLQGMGTCAICLGHFRRLSNGQVPPHGHHPTLRGESCPGSLHDPFEISSHSLERTIIQLSAEEQLISTQRRQLEKLPPRLAEQHEDELRRTVSDLAELQGLLATLRRRLALWSEQPLPDGDFRHYGKATGTHHNLAMASAR